MRLRQVIDAISRLINNDMLTRKLITLHKVRNSLVHPNPPTQSINELQASGMLEAFSDVAAELNFVIDLPKSA